jgi:hypothetical protein
LGCTRFCIVSASFEADFLLQYCCGGASGSKLTVRDLP